MNPHRFRTSTLALLVLVASGVAAIAQAQETLDGFRPFGTYLVRSRLKVTGDKSTPVPIKPLKLKVFTDGVSIRIATEGDENGGTSYRIYRSDGIGRPSANGAGLEVIPGVQATSDSGGMHQHLRITRESLTLTTFPGISDQTVVTHAVAIEEARGERPAAPAEPAPETTAR